MTKKFVLSGYFGFKNFGDEAILNVIINKLRQNDADITVITSDIQYTKEKFNDVNCVYTFDIKRIVQSIQNTDYLISGGGSLLQDTTSLKSLIYYLFVIFTAILFKKSVLIFAQGIGPINSTIGKFFTKMLLKRCKYISVRDNISQELLKSWGISSELVPDPIFSSYIQDTKKENILAIQLRNFKTMNKNFIMKLAKTVTDKFSTKEIHIYSFQDSIDYEICKTFENTLKNINPEIKTKLHYNQSNEDIISGIAKAQYLIAMRFHAIIIGLLSGAKTFAINYDIKVEKLAQEFNLPFVTLEAPDFKEIENMGNQDLEYIEEKLKTKIYDWTNFEKAINEK